MLTKSSPNAAVDKYLTTDQGKTALLWLPSVRHRMTIKN